MSATDVVVVTGGDRLAPALREHVPDGALVVAADSGVQHALDVGLTPDVAVGDFDSCDAGVLDAVSRGGTRLVRHAAAKDETDLQLALDHAAGLAPRRITVLGGHGGRLDHFLANVLLLASPAYAGSEVVAFMGAARVVVVRTSTVLTARHGDVVTLLPVHGPARGVRTCGLLYPLVGEDLPSGTSRGVSNELSDPEAEVSLTGGTLLAVQTQVGA